MLFKKKNKKEKVYDFKYEIYWNNGGISKGNITNSIIAPEVIFLENKFTYFSKGKCTYFNSNEIRQIEIFDLIEKVDDK